MSVPLGETSLPGPFGPVLDRRPDGRTPVWINHKKAGKPPITADHVDVDALNKYFVEIGVNTSRTVDRSGPELPVRLPRVSTGSFTVTPVTPDYLRSVVGRMNGSSACGADGLCIRFIKMCVDSLCHVLSHIVNSSVTSHTVPDSWKLTLVHPIPKAAKSDDFSRYRPILILTTIAKITERVFPSNCTPTSLPTICSPPTNTASGLTIPPTPRCSPSPITCFMPWISEKSLCSACWTALAVSIAFRMGRCCVSLSSTELTRAGSKVTWPITISAFRSRPLEGLVVARYPSPFLTLSVHTRDLPSDRYCTTYTLMTYRCIRMTPPVSSPTQMTSSCTSLARRGTSVGSSKQWKATCLS